MARVTIEDCLEQVDSPFGLVHLAVRRVLQLRRGAAPLVEAPKNKEVVLALREIAAGKVTFDNVRQFEELEPLPEVKIPQAKAQKILHEVEEIVEASSAYSGPVEFVGKQIEAVGDEEIEADRESE